MAAVIALPILLLFIGLIVTAIVTLIVSKDKTAKVLSGAFLSLLGLSIIFFVGLKTSRTSSVENVEYVAYNIPNQVNTTEYPTEYIINNTPAQADAATTVTRIGIIGLPLLILIVVGIVLLFSKNKTPRYIGIGLLSVLGLLVVMGLLTARVSHQPRVDNIVRPIEQHWLSLNNAYEAEAETDLGRSELENLPRIWAQGIEEQFMVNQYPSIESALQSLGSELAKYIDEHVTKKRRLEYSIKKPDIIIFREQYDKDLVNKLANILEKKLDQSVFVESESKDVSKSQIGIYPHIKVTSEATKTGRIEIETIWPNNFTRTLQGKSAGKPWVDSFAAFANMNPHKNYIVARSSSSCTNQNWASQEAMNNAVSLVGRRLKNENRNNNYSISFSDLQISGMIEDIFTQRLQGRKFIYRQAILIDVSSDKIEKLVRRIQSRRAGIRSDWAWTILSTIGLFALICVVYLFLNAATRGYYSIALKIASAVLIIVGVVVLLLLT